MKKITIGFIGLLIILCFLGISVASAADVLLDKEIKNITFKKDKNGNDYARIIISESRTLNGISYTKDVPVMVFGEKFAYAKTLKKGGHFRAVASTSEYRGSISYSVIDFVK